MQLILVIAGVTAYISLPRLPRDGLRVLASSVYGFLLFLVFMWLYSPVPLYITNNEHRAMRYLKNSEIHLVVEAYQHGSSYPEAVGCLGLNSSRACATELAPPPSGYVFELCLPKMPIRDLLDDSSTRIPISLRIGWSLGL